MSLIKLLLDVLFLTCPYCEYQTNDNEAMRMHLVMEHGK